MKLQSFHFAILHLLFTTIFVIYLAVFSKVDYELILDFLLYSFVVIELLFYFYSKWNYINGFWNKIGKTKYLLTGFRYILFIFLIFFILINIFSFIKDRNFELNVFLYFILICSMELMDKNYHLIIKKKYLTIIDDNRFKDYSKDEIIYISIRNKYLAVAIFKDDKVFNFPIEDFKNDDLSTLNEFIKIENFEQNKIV